MSIQIILCAKCGKPNTPKINPDGTLTMPSKCKNRFCRNILDRDAVESNKKRIISNLKPDNRRGFFSPPRPRKTKPKICHFCTQCEMLFGSADGLHAHNLRRHNT